MLLAGGHAAQNERELRGYRFLWNGVQGAGDAVTFRDLSWHAPFSALGVRIVGANSAAILVGLKGYQQVPCDCYIERVLVVADRSGSIVFDIYRVPFASFPPQPAHSITPLEIGRPKLEGQQSSQDRALFGWSRALSSGDILAYNVRSVSGGINAVTLSLFVNRNNQP